MKLDEEIRKAILHDSHKVFKTKHGTKHLFISDIKLNTSADKDAGKLSRPFIATKRGEMSGEYLNKSFVFEKNYIEKDRKRLGEFIDTYLNNNKNVEILHERLLNDNILSNFNEITSMPYTSLKYHTLLTVALHYNYLIGRDLKDLYLNYSNEIPKERFTIIFRFDSHYFVINNDIDGGRIGSKATTNFGDTINRIGYHIDLPDFIIENLKRTRSWSVGLQYLEDSLRILKESDMCNPL